MLRPVTYEVASNKSKVHDDKNGNGEDSQHPGWETSKAVVAAGNGHATESTALLVYDSDGVMNRAREIERLRSHLNDAYNDDEDDMTYGRRLARYLSQYEWYYPRPSPTVLSGLPADSTILPSLDAAWAYFEHVTLQRHFKRGTEAALVGGASYRRAETGEAEEPTQLYSVWDTPEAKLGDFGVGLGIYFYKLRWLAIILFMGGIINLPVLFYYHSPDYESSGEGLATPSLMASAICVDRTWAPCPTCDLSQYEIYPKSRMRFAQANTTDGEVLTFHNVNNCRISGMVGYVNLFSVIFFVIAFFYIQAKVKQDEDELDRIELTTTDYAVTVRNPPEDANDPLEWKNFFEHYGRVNNITIALHNEDIINALLARRQLLKTLAKRLPSGIEVTGSVAEDAAFDLARQPTQFERFMMEPTNEEIKERVKALDDSIINDLSKRTYEVSQVFVVFEEEEVQQDVLHEMSTGEINALFNRTDRVPKHHLFRGETVLHVVEPPEPSSVRWEDLDDFWYVRLAQCASTLFVTSLLVLGACALVIWVRRNFGPTMGALTISLANSIFLYTNRFTTSFEAHPSESEKETSLCVKTTLAQWVITALLVAAITPFSTTLDSDETATIPSMHAIFVTQLATNPIIQLLDPFGNFERHVLAPRATSQNTMDSYFAGTEFYLAERYTIILTLLFTTFYYATLYPAGFFWAAASLTVLYWADKFSVLRIWTPSPMLGTEIAEFTRMYFFAFILVMYAIMTCYNFSSFPYDNACKLEGVEAPSNYMGNFSALDGTGRPLNITVEQNATVFEYCNQNLFRDHSPFKAFIAFKFKKGDDRWMSESQHEVAYYLRWTATIAFVALAVRYSRFLARRIKQFFFGGFEAHEDNDQRPFSELTDVYGYVPQMKISGELYPTLLCDISKISDELVDFQDPSDPTLSSHNVIYDLPGLVNDDPRKSVFSTVTQWPA